MVAIEATIATAREERRKEQGDCTTNLRVVIGFLAVILVDVYEKRNERLLVDTFSSLACD